MPFRLQTYLKTRPLESNDVQFARQQLRRQYMDMLFLPRSQGGVSAPKMLDILSLLWMDTTHALIAKYRAKIAQIDKAIADKPPERGNRGRSKRGGGSQHNAEAGGHQGHVARRRAVQTFRAFLGKEEEYWTQLLVRMINAFRVPQAVPCLTALQISASALTTTRDSLQVDDPEQRAQQVPSKTAILLCHRALVSFGDLVRYRELYQEDVTKKGKKFLTGDESAERPWTKAAECYNQARLLVPEDGQPFNQLAVLASYSNDQLSSVYYYFRAGCVTQDFKTAQPNLEMTLSKALNKYEDSPIDAKAPADQVFMQDFIALQAMIYLQKTDPAVVEAQLDKSLELYKTCLAQRAVSAEAILKIVCTCIAAWHSDRMPHHSNKDSEVQPKPVNEALALRLVLDYLGTTFRESARSVEAMFEGKPPTEPASRDIIASRIAPVLRRSLQAIRCGSKWLLSRSSNGKLATYGAHVSAFWNDYALLVNTFVKRFPTKHLPDLPSDLVLEENIDLCGFLPLGAALKAPKELASALSQGTSSHPNMEHLMRIADILSDAALIASSPVSSN